MLSVVMLSVIVLNVVEPVELPFPALMLVPGMASSSILMRSVDLEPCMTSLARMRRSRLKSQLSCSVYS